MSTSQPIQSNFAQLAEHDEQLLRLGLLAERYFPEDPNTSIIKLRQLAELLAQQVAARIGIYKSAEENQYDLIRRLQDKAVFTREIAQLFGEVRRAGNVANHEMTGDHRTALAILKITWQLGLWFHRTFKDSGFKAGAFIPPKPPKDETEDLKVELARLNEEQDRFQSEHKDVVQRLSSTEEQLRKAESEQTFWEAMAVEADTARIELKSRLESVQVLAEAQAKSVTNEIVKAANTAAASIHLDEAETRKLIDDQLRQAGWEVDSATMRYGTGCRPEKGKNKAIAEWPTESGPADYVLFVGLTPMASVEAKRKNKDVSACLQQAKRYCRGFQPSSETTLHPQNWGEERQYRLPFVFSANGRPYLRQLATKSGIWFCDVRRSNNLSYALEGWYTPEGLTAALKRDDQAAYQQLKKETFNYGFTLREYQKQAIRAAESAIENGQREMLLAMATGTGKTKTCIALIYRLLKTKRFRRILFLVDRSALGEQAANAFKETRMESLQTFADVFGIKELDEQSPDTDTAVHLATVQGMVLRTLYPAEGTTPPAVDQYDCIIVDECHRGYLLDREMSETELAFRSYEDYISKYRRILDYYDAYKIGLTATPALHTTQIFNAPIFTYSYREAVIDGFLIDHEPPIRITTQLSNDGIVWNVGEDVSIYDAETDKIDLFTTPDEIRIDVDEFNKKVITEPFNQVVCDVLAQELDPSSREKTLIFCVDNAHCDIVVILLKKAFEKVYGGVDEDAVIKITGAADKPLELIRKFKNERHPNVAVTVDLLTTGIDVPEICNIVFLRRMNSRILYDQMLGRATRLCNEIGKETFRVFDAVRIYEALQNLTAMRPVVVDPKISFTQLAGELARVEGEAERKLVRDQFIAKLQRKKRHLSDSAAADFETQVGTTADGLIQQLKAMTLPEVASWFKRNLAVGEILDRKSDSVSPPVYISQHPDRLVSVERGYGTAKKPEDYLKEFTDFIRTHTDEIPALITVMTRPRDLTRKQLRELALELDRAGFSETNLATAWREMTNQDIAARIVGFIRQAAVGDPLMPYEQRVDGALQRMLSSRSWTMPQRQWLQKIAAQTKANVIVDRDAIDDPDLIFSREGGGFSRLDRMFGGELQDILNNFNESIWQSAA